MKIDTPILVCIAIALSPASSFAMPVMAGIDDQFQNGPDALEPSAEFQTAVAGFGGCQDLDLVAGVGAGVNNRQVAHTFTDLPNGIVQATLEIRIRAGNDPSVLNDGIFLSFVDENTVHYSDAIRWRRSFGPVSATPPYYPMNDTGLVGSWQFGDEVTLVLELSALPLPDGSTVNLTPWMSRRGFLDVNISDETGADYFQLSWDIGPTDVALPGASMAGNLRCFPNPCRGSGAVRFSLDRPGFARVGIFDVTGRRVRELEPGSYGAGEQRIDWRAVDDQGRRLPAGTYFVRLETADRIESSKLVVLR